MSEIDAGTIEAEAIEEIGQELVPTGGAPTTLFRTDDPVEIVNQATEVATALSGVLKKQHLTKRIGDKDHVLVEGWTLLGSMLGVFPVVEWTRRISVPDGEGWEARVEARTKDGSVVGAAEAECLRTEKRWRTADDYAVRSMAQTRAISKALRAPLGFVVALAGFEATPADEMPDRPQAEPAFPKPFDPETDLAEGAIRGANAAKEIGGQLDRFDPTVDWQLLLAEAVEEKWGYGSWREMETEAEKKDFWRRLSNSVWWIEQAVGHGDFPPVPAETIVAGIAYGFSGIAVEVPYKEVPKPGDLLTPEQQAETKAAGVEDIPFVDEEEARQ